MSTSSAIIRDMGKWTDVGCNDFAAAARNREMIANKENIVWWLWMESVRDKCPYSKPLPYWIPQGDIPKIGKREEREARQYGMYIMDEGIKW